MKPTVLLLEDDLVDAKWLKKIVEEEGYTCEWVTNGKGVKKAIQEYGDRIVMAILDLNIKGSKEDNFGEERIAYRGAAVAKYIEQQFRSIPIIFASVYTADEIKKIASSVNYAGAWAGFNKELLSDDTESNVLREAIRLAIQKQEEYEEELAKNVELDAGAEILQEDPAASLLCPNGKHQEYRLRLKVYNNIGKGDNLSQPGFRECHDFDSNCNSSYVILAPEDICFITSLRIDQLGQQDNNKLVVGLVSGEEFALYISNAKFEALYGNWARNGMPDFLCKGRTLANRTTYVNIDHVLRLGTDMIIFKDKKRSFIQAGPALYQSIELTLNQQ